MGTLRVNPVLVEQVNGLGFQPFSEASTTCRMCSGLAVEATLFAGVAVEPKLGGDGHLAAEGGEGFADEFLVGEGAIDFGCIEKGDALFDGRADDGIISCLSPAGP